MARALLPVRAGCMADMFAGLQLGGVRGAAAASRAPVLVRPRALGPAACWRGAGANSVRGLTAGPGPVGRGEADGLILAGSQSAVLAVAMRSAAGLVRDTKQQGMGLGGTRGISSTAPRTTGLNDFFVSFPDLDKDDKPMYPAVGRAWTAAELRQKSFDDLHKLWWILLKERNSLAVERHAARSRGLQIPNPRRIRKVRKSMSRIKCVLGERKRMKVLIRSQAAESGVEASQ